MRWMQSAPFLTFGFYKQKAVGTKRNFVNVSYGLSCVWEGGNSYFLGTTQQPLCWGMQLSTLFSAVYLTSISSQKTVMCCTFDPTSPKVLLLCGLHFSLHCNFVNKLYHLSVHTENTP